MLKILRVLLVSVFCLALFAQPVAAADPKWGKIKAGDNTEIEFTGNTREVNGKKEYEYKATISSLPMYFENRRIDTLWKYDNGMFYTGVNYFTAEVKGETVTISVEDVKYKYTPTIYLDNKKQKLPANEYPMLKDDLFNPNYFGNTIEWDYGTFKRDLRLIEGLIQEFYVFTSNPGVEIRVEVAKEKDTKFSYERELSAFDSKYQPISIVNGVITKDELAKATYPIYIDPTSSFVTSASDGYLYAQSGAWGSDAAWTYVRDLAGSGTIETSSTINRVGLQERINSSYDYYAYIHRGYEYFDTSALSSSNISTVTLYLYGTSFYAEMGAWTLVIQDGQPTYPSVPLVTADYNRTYYSGSYGALASGSMVTGAYNAISLTTAIVNKTGITKFVFREKEHDIDNVDPFIYGESNKVSGFMWNSYEQGAGYQPYLEVTYYASAAPTVTTNAASGVSFTQAQLNGILNTDGGEDCPYGFYYSKTSGALDNFTGWSTSNITGGTNFNVIQSGLDTGTTYYYRAVAYNSVGTINGTEQNFTTDTSFSPPSNFNSIPISNSSVLLSFILGNGAAQTYIRGKLNEAPVSTSDGFLSYNSTGTSFEQTGLIAGETYYFRAWGYDVTSGNYTSTYKDTIATTFADTTTASVIGDNSVPSGWVATMDSSRMNNNPFAYTINSTADTIGMPEPTAWMLYWIIGAIMMGTVAMVLGLTWVGGAVASGVVVGAGISVGVMPFWIVIVFVILVVGAVYAARELGL